MTDPTTPTEAGLFRRVGDTRRVRGLLAPYRELSRMSVSGTAPIAFDAGTIAIPADPAVVGLNRDHDRFDPIGRAVALEDSPAGVVAEFEVARTPEGDAFLADPTRRKLSPELRGIVRDPVDPSRGVAAVLVGAGAVTEGAFASAGLFAIGPVEDAAPPAPAGEPAPTDPSPAGSEPPAGEAASTAAPDTEPAPAELDSETPAPAGAATPEAATAAEEEGIVPEVPQQVADAAAIERAEELGARAVFAAVAAARAGDSSAEDMLAALADIKHTGAGSLGGVNGEGLRPAWLGEVWNGRAYRRKYIDLVTHGDIAGVTATGYRLDQGTALVQRWGGNKAELPTGTASVTPVSSTLLKYGFAADIAREFFDLPGGEELIEAFMRGVVNSYARITDADALAQIVAAAGTAIAPAAYPAGYSPALGMVIQGMEAVDDAGDTPSFAILNRLAWRELLYTPKDKLPEFISFAVAFGEDGGEGTGDGKVKLVRGDIGIEDTPAVIVGSKAALTLNETNAGNPIQVDALDIARGGVDRAVVGYLQVIREFDAGIVLVGTTDAP